MNNILSELGIDTNTAQAQVETETETETQAQTETTDDELLALLMEDTKYRENNENTENLKYEYTDFSTEENQPNVLDVENPATAVSLALSTLPIDTIVETVDITITNAIISGLRIDSNVEKCQDLETNAKDLVALQKATKQYLNSKEIKITPLAALLLTTSMIYGKKFLFAKRLQKIERKATKLERENIRLQNEIIQYQSTFEKLQMQQKNEENKQAKVSEFTKININNRKRKRLK